MAKVPYATVEGSSSETMASEAMPVEEFVVKAIKSLRREPWKGIHTVFSGLNEAIRKLYDLDPVQVTKKLEADGVIEIRGAKRGATVYLPGEAPAVGRGNDQRTAAVIAQVLKVA
jgi:hypothetical protein